MNLHCISLESSVRAKRFVVLATTESRVSIGRRINAFKTTVARVCSNVVYFNNINLYLTAKLLKQGYRYHRIRRAISKFYHRQSKLLNTILV